MKSCKCGKFRFAVLYKYSYSYGCSFDVMKRLTFTGGQIEWQHWGHDQELTQRRKIQTKERESITTNHLLKRQI